MEDSKEDIMGEEIYQKALEYAKKKHEGQFRIGGAPFIVHPIAVAEILRQDGKQVEYRVAAVFHDLLEDTDASFLFDISTIFLSIRNFATCYSLAYGKINFHRYSALNLGDKSIPISIEDYKTLESARLLATRGVGSFPTQSDSIRLIKCFDIIDSWMKSLLGEFK